MKKTIIILGIIAVIVFVLIPFIRLSIGNKYCCEQSLVRWKYAIYYGECWEGEGGDGCKFTKIEGTGWREYFGLKDFECPCEKTWNYIEITLQELNTMYDTHTTNHTIYFGSDSAYHYFGQSNLKCTQKYKLKKQELTLSSEFPLSEKRKPVLLSEILLTTTIAEDVIGNEYQKYDSYPFVSAEEIAMIAPFIKKWTDFYKIDFAQARFESENRTCFNCPPDTTNLYYREFTQKHDTDKRIDVDYSPDKQRYVDLGISDGTYYNEEDKKYYFIGWDDCQEIYLIDRKQKHQNMIIWLGVASHAEAVFW
jgi:hypothetical protein